MKLAHIKIAKAGLVAYWVSVIIASLLYFETTYGYYHVIGGVAVLAAHLLETLLFHSLLKQYSHNVVGDKLKILLFGFLVPLEVKLKHGNKQ